MSSIPTDPGSFDIEGLITTYILYGLERAGIQVQREISTKSQNFLAILRQKQPNTTLAMIHWTNNVQKNVIKPTWKNFFLLLRLINLDDLAEMIKSYFIGTPMEQDTISRIEAKAKGGDLT